MFCQLSDGESFVRSATVFVQVHLARAPSLSFTTHTQVGSVPSLVLSSSPPVGIPFRAGDTITFGASASGELGVHWRCSTAADDGPLPDTSYIWNVLLRHNQHVHSFASRLIGPSHRCSRVCHRVVAALTCRGHQNRGAGGGRPRVARRHGLLDLGHSHRLGSAAGCPRVDTLSRQVQREAPNQSSRWKGSLQR